ncbi:MAG TPA: DNA alkylation response protein, partial [Actinomycetota bacterium]
DVLRAIGRQPEALVAFREEIAPECAAEPRVARTVAEAERALADTDRVEARARWLVERLALALEAALLLRSAPPAVAEAFCASRLDRDHGLAFGTLPAGVETATIVERHAPVTTTG